MSFFRQMMNSKDPSVSSSRFLSVITTLTILYVWAFACLWVRALVDIPMGVYSFAGLVIAGGVGSKIAERPSAGSTSETITKTTEGS